MPDHATLEASLRDRTRFRSLWHTASCTSTQDLAADAHRDSGPPGDAVFWADHQTRGRGRQQHEWNDEPGADLTVTFRATLRLPNPVALPAAAPIAVAQACEPQIGEALRLKWPNDVLHHGRKLAGVLIDAGALTPDTYLIGIGINCNRIRFPPDLEPAATSLALITGHEVARADLLLALATALDRLLDDLVRGSTRELQQQFQRRLGLVGRRVEVQAGGPRTGTLTDLDFEHLVLDDAQRIPLGIVTSIRAADRG